MTARPATPCAWMCHPAGPNPSGGTFTRGALAALGAACLLAAGTLAGCGSTPAAGTARAAAPAAPPPLATSFADAAGSGWAVVPMGGPAAQHNNFWELFVRPAAASRWRQATPAGVADNGGLEVTGGGGSLVTGFRPSQDLTFSPLAASSDDGVTWSPSGPVYPGLADAPDALAAGPGGRLIALTSGGGAELGTVTGDGQAGGTSWTHLSSVKALAATPAGRACGPAGLTAAAFGRSGVPMLGASCGRSGVAGIFTDSGGWHAAGPAVPAALARQDIEVLALASDGNTANPGLVALLRAGTGPGASVTAAWSADGGSGWTLSAPLRVGAGPLTSTAIGPGGAVGIILSTGRGETAAGPGASWRALPALPRWTATLALGPAGQVDAIAAHLGTFSDWRLAPGPGGSGPDGWSLAQTLHVTIPYGSSG